MVRPPPGFVEILYSCRAMPAAWGFVFSSRSGGMVLKVRNSMTGMRYLGLGVLLIALAGSAQEVIDYVEVNNDQYMCWEKRMEEVYNGTLAELSPCGTECPEVVKSEATIKDASECPVDGWVVYGAEDWSGVGPVYIRRLRDPHSEADTLPCMPNSWWHKFSPDGEWITYTHEIFVENNRKWYVYIVKRDGSVHEPLTYQGRDGLDTVEALLPGWWHKSPNEDPENKIYEMYFSKTSGWVKACQIDLSGEKPKLLWNETWRYAADNIPGHTMSGATAVAGDIVLWDEAIRDVKVPWMEKYETAEPTTLYTIPDGGRGVASAEHLYPVYGVFNCGQEISWDGTLLIHNPGKVVSDCVPNGHHGFGILRTKRYTDPISTVGQWWLDEEHGAVSVNWAPEEIDGVKQWTAHSGDGKFSNWGNWAFSNVNEYVIGHNNAGKAPDAAKCGWVIHWPTHTWYRYTPEGVVSWNAQLFIDEGVDVNRPIRRVQPHTYSRMQNLSQWVDILGRKSPSGELRLPRGVYVKNGKRELRMK